MAAPEHVRTPSDSPKNYTSPRHVPEGWVADRPGEVGAGQPHGPAFGVQGPDQGYALRLVKLLEPELVLVDGEHVDDVVHGLVLVGCRRAALFGRAPVLEDLRVAAKVFGFLGDEIAPDALAARRRRFEGIADPHHYFESLEVVAAVDDDVIRRRAAEVPAGEFRF